MTKWEKFKAHLKENWDLYAGGAFALGAIGLAVYLKSKQGTAVEIPTGTQANVTSIVVQPKAAAFAKQNCVVRIISESGLGRPGYLVRDVTTGEYYPSQQALSELSGISSRQISQHLNGKIPDAGGHQLERVYFAK